jgi:hypothetical protein
MQAATYKILKLWFLTALMALSSLGKAQKNDYIWLLSEMELL